MDACIDPKTANSACTVWFSHKLSFFAMFGTEKHVMISGAIYKVLSMIATRNVIHNELYIHNSTQELTRVIGNEPSLYIF